MQKSSAGKFHLEPSLSTVGEFVPGYEASGWFGVGAPKATPAEIVDKLNKEVNAGLADPKMKARLNREVGQGDPGGQHQAGLILNIP